MKYIFKIIFICNILFLIILYIYILIFFEKDLKKINKSNKK